MRYGCGLQRRVPQCSQLLVVCCEQVQEYTSLLALSLLEREHECIGTPSHAWRRYELTAVGSRAALSLWLPRNAGAHMRQVKAQRQYTHSTLTSG